MPLALYMDDHVPIAITEGTRPICSRGGRLARIKRGLKGFWTNAIEA